MNIMVYIQHGLEGFVIIMSLSVMMLCFGCSVDDERDLCCRSGSMMRYVYRPHGSDEFDRHVRSLRHFLFDSSGMFLKEVEAGTDPRRQELSLEAGRYTMVTIGNMKDGGRVNHEENPELSGLRLTAGDGAMQSEQTDNNDELFWGLRHFDIDADGMITDSGPDRRWDDYNAPATEMSNIHCHLNVRLEWNGQPEGPGEYEVELSGVPTGYTLDPESAEKAGGFLVPATAGTGVHRRWVPLSGYELNVEFITLRLCDDIIPTLRIYYGARQISPDIDLKQAFRKWGWYPSRIHVQEYSILVRLYGDRRAEVTPVIDGSVSDWINGGTFS